MYIKIRTPAGREAVITVSKTDTIRSLKSQVLKEFDIQQSKQRIFFRGKELDDGYTLYDYNVNVSDTVQVMEKPEIIDSNKTSTIVVEKEPEEIPCESPYFRVGDVVDALDVTFGAWFQGNIIEIVKCPPENEIYYKVQFTSVPSTAPTMVDIKAIRPVSKNKLSVESINKNDVVMVNYNLSNPEERGYWYDMKINKIIKGSKHVKSIRGTVFAGSERVPMDDMQITSVDEIMEIRENKLLSERRPEELEDLQTEPTFKRKTAPLCSTCKDNPRRKCRACGCEKCGGKNDPEKQVVCDECDYSYHIGCLKVPLAEVPDCDDWYCDDCRNDEEEVIKAGGKLKQSAKRANSACKRDWGRGMACVGRTKDCSLVEKNHFGPIPGVEVGTLWRYRFQVSESGVHSPHVAGIHGRSKEGAFSLVLSGGYEDDVDRGDEFVYTGSGGRDLSGNKRTAEQSSSQKLTLTNCALAVSCNAKFDRVKGGKAKNWKGGRPVRVVRNYKLRKHSIYAPKEGNRYDGIYKVVRYYPEKGLKGHLVWKFVLRRDDPSPAPWTKEGKARSAKLGLVMQYPEHYEAKNESVKRGVKRGNDEKDEDTAKIAKRTKMSFILEKKVTAAIAVDSANEKLWASIQSIDFSGHKAFLDKVSEDFKCVCCMSLVYDPVTTSCSHNICQVCLNRSIASGLTACPSCRTELGKGVDTAINKNLRNVLQTLFPGYLADH